MTLHQKKVFIHDRTRWIPTYLVSSENSWISSRYLLRQTSTMLLVIWKNWTNFDHCSLSSLKASIPLLKVSLIFSRSILFFSSLHVSAVIRFNSSLVSLTLSQAENEQTIAPWRACVISLLYFFSKNTNFNYQNNWHVFFVWCQVISNFDNKWVTSTAIK